MPLFRCLLVVGLLQGLAFTPIAAVGQNEPGAGKAAVPNGNAVPDQAALDKKFAEDLSGVIFSGSYSTSVGDEEKPVQMEKYTITKVTKLKDDDWLFATRIQYGKNDVAIPLKLQVKWAGDTPMITLTELAIPGLGTFTSRVLIHGNRYAGTWQHGNVGGHLWGRIEKIDKPANGDKSPDKSRSQSGESSRPATTKAK